MLEVLNAQPPHRRVVGVDVEWFNKNPTAVVQIASGSHCFVLHVSYFDNRRLPLSVTELLERPDVVKCGVNIKGDAKRMKVDFGVALQSVMNVEEYAELLLGVGVGHHSLKALAQLLLDDEMPLKTKKMACSNWELQLTDREKQYAADDACASYGIGKHLVDTAVEKELFQLDAPEGLVNWLAATAAPAAQQLKSVVRQHVKALRNEREKNEQSAPVPASASTLRPAVNIPVSVISKEGDFLFQCNQSQAKFYTVDRGIANILEYYGQTHKPHKIQLLFDPKRKTRLCVYFKFGLPCTDKCPFAHGIDDLVPSSRQLLDEEVPSCAICLSTQSLIRHAVVPPSFRKYLPSPLNNPPDDDFIPVCRQCQTVMVNKVNEEVERVNHEAASRSPQFLKEPTNLRRCCSYARLLSSPEKHKDIPKEKLEDIRLFVAQNACELGLVAGNSGPIPIGSCPSISDSDLAKVAALDSNELQQKTVMNALVGEDLAEAQNFVAQWWKFIREKCFIVEKRSNSISLEKWKEIKKSTKDDNAHRSQHSTDE